MQVFFSFFVIFLFDQICIRDVATAKYNRIDPASTKVVISGEAIIAGSNFNFLANIGIEHPRSLAKNTVPIKLMPVTKPNNQFW